MQKVELLAPAGNLEKLKIAVIYGADAVYLAGESYGLRAAAGNFTLEEMKEGVAFAHERGAKVFVTVNIFAHNEDLENLSSYLQEIEKIGVDAIIVSDPGVWLIAQELKTNMEIHISTQANNTNWASCLFWEKHGAKRIVLARELSLKEIQEIRARTNLELEMFVHGAMCISYSGRCLLSNYMTDRDANRGECAQPCRWNYALQEEKRPGLFYPIEEDERGSYIFNSQDLCLIEHLPEIIQAGVNSLKIEGRMKSIHYVATIVQAYRQALDAYYKNPQEYSFDPAWYEEITKVSHRDYTEGFLFGKPQSKDHNYETSSYLRSYDFVGLVLDYDGETGIATIEQRNNFRLGDELEFTGPETPRFTQQLTSMRNDAEESIEVAPHPRQIVEIPVSQRVRPWDLVRRAKDEK